MTPASGRCPTACWKSSASSKATQASPSRKSLPVWVTRIRDAADKRYVALHPTAESQRIKALLEGAWAGALESASSRLLPEEREQIAASLPALQRLASILSEPE